MGGLGVGLGRSGGAGGRPGATPKHQKGKMVKVRTNMFYNVLEDVTTCTKTKNKQTQKTTTATKTTNNQTKKRSHKETNQHHQTNKQSIKQTIYPTTKKSKEETIKQTIKQQKTQRRNLILKNMQLPIDRPRRLLCYNCSNWLRVAAKTEKLARNNCKTLVIVTTSSE